LALIETGTSSVPSATCQAGEAASVDMQARKAGAKTSCNTYKVVVEEGLELGVGNVAARLAQGLPGGDGLVEPVARRLVGEGLRVGEDLGELDGVENVLARAVDGVEACARGDG
jgi:hypothetical protein